MRDTGDFLILIGDSLDSVNHQNADITPLDRRNRTDDAEFFNGVVHLTAFPKSCGINQGKSVSFEFEWRVDRITRSACDRRDNHTVFFRQRVNHR